ncbi:MAG: RNA polymerase sigma factor [Gemmataceae bacterium]
MLGTGPDAEDAFQAAFLILAQKAGSVGWQETVGGWLHEVAYRVALRARRDLLRRNQRERQVADMSRASVTDQGDLRELLDAELSRLPEKYRAPLVLCYLEGKTNQEAAMLLGWPEGTLFSRLARGRELLRARLGRHTAILSASGLALALAESAAAAAVPPALVTSTLEAAALAHTAKALAAGAISARVAALIEGVLRNMFWLKIKTLGLWLLALAAVGGTGIAALSYRSLANGEATELAALVPAPLPVPKPTASKPVEKDGLTVTVAPALSRFGAGQPITFKVHFKNTSTKDLSFLRTPRYYYDWQFQFGSWRTVNAAKREGGGREPAVLKVGETLTVEVRIDNTFLFTWQGPQSRPVLPRHDLPTGEYELTLSIITPEGSDRRLPLPWEGPLQTAPVTVVIEQRQELPASAKEVIDKVWANWMKGKRLYGMPNGGDPEARLTFVVDDAGKPAEVHDPSAVIALLRGLRAQNDEEAKELSYLAMLLLRLQHHKFPGRGELLPGKRADNDPENCLQIGDYRVNTDKGTGRRTIADITLVSGSRIYRATVTFDAKGVLENIKLVDSGISLN